MDVSQKTVLITGANRGLGRALVEEALRRGAKRVYAGMRTVLPHPNVRVRPLRLDVTSPEQIREALEEVDTLDLLVNNAGVSVFDDLSQAGIIEQHLAVNLLGPFLITEAFLPLLKRSGGAILNHLSLAALAPLPVVPAYSISKAAALSMTQWLRMCLAGQGVAVHSVFLGPIDTDMSRGFDIPKISPESAAKSILDGLEQGEEDIFPDPVSQTVAAGWRTGVGKALEREFTALLPQR